MTPQKQVIIGNSSGMIFPAEILKEFNMTKKSPFFIEKTNYGFKVILDQSQNTQTNPEDVSWLRSFIKKHKKGYMELAKR